MMEGKLPSVGGRSHTDAENDKGNIK